MQRRSFIKNTIVTSTGMMLFPSFAKTGFAEEEKSLSEVEKYFINPPLSASPWCFWMWMNGNITKEGIRIGFYYSQAQDWNHPGGAVSLGEGYTNIIFSINWNMILRQIMENHISFPFIPIQTTGLYE